MNQLAKKLFILILTLIIGGCFGVYSVQAQNNELILGVIDQCDIKYTGNSCVAKFDIANNTGEVLDGTAFFDIGYNGVCGSTFEVGGIDAWYNNQASKMEWNNESKKFISTGFEIPNGLSQPNLEIHTSSALCPGEYTFALSIKGTFEEEKYITPPVVIGGGGGGGGYSYTPPSTLSAAAQKVDANKDNKIDVLDFDILMANWGSTSANNAADFNGDSKVDVFDFNLLMIHWTL